MKSRQIVIISIAAVLLLACCAGIWFLHPITRIRQSLCAHETFEDGICTSCGLICTHEAWKDGHCAECGIACRHEWQNAKCTVCGQICEHPQYESGFCTTCGHACEHSFVEGFCIYCDEACIHDWNNGKCRICGLQCLHEHHDRNTLKCVECGLEVPHRYISGKCECGAEPVFYDSFLPDEYYVECKHPGTVEKLTYMQKLHYQGDEEVSKNINIYLPYGYSEDRKYNVLVLIHGGWDNEDSWITKVYDYGFPLIMKNIYDNMIEQKLCEPLIIVCPTTYNGPLFSNESGVEHMAIELRETILPYIADHYSTYAASGAVSDLQAAREHFGIGGMSNGSLYALNSGMQRDLDLFSNFICFSGNSEPYAIVEAINSDECKDLPISYFYAGAGYYDDQWQNTYYGFQIIVENTARLTEGENAFYRDVNGGHDFSVWNVNIFNALQMAFPKVTD